MVMTLAFQPQDGVRNHLTRIERTSFGDYAEFILAAEDAKTAQMEIARGNKLFPVTTAFYVRSTGLESLSHAVRIGQEAIELFRTGQITFPRPEAAHLLAVKQGKVPYAEVAEEIERLVDEVEIAASHSGFPDKADMQPVDDLVFRVYRQQILGQIKP